jgi:DNA-binding transcriptional LysR family regulator
MHADQVNIPSVDLNLLKVFVTIMNEKSITAAGTRLGLTQSATSNALNRLRAFCQDPLFVRTSTGMEPTPFAIELFTPVSDALHTIKETFEQRATFDAATSTRTFRVMQNNFGELQFLPDLIERLQTLAPMVKIVSLAISREQYREALEDNTADLAIGRLPSGQFVQRHLFDDSLICLMRRGHPIEGTLTMDKYLSTPQLAFAETFQSELLLRRALLKKASERPIVLKVSSTASVAATLAKTDLIAAVPLSWYKKLPHREAFKTFELPFETGKLQIHQFWHERNHHDLGHKWLRHQIAELFIDFGSRMAEETPLFN